MEIQFDDNERDEIIKLAKIKGYKYILLTGHGYKLHTSYANARLAQTRLWAAYKQAKIVCLQRYLEKEVEVI